jgi:UDP:flavonoid glycosyltransferase YjiC (YdhE family)
VPARVLFLTSNGTGLGHLTRGMAIARRLESGFEPSFFTLSTAAPEVTRAGFHVEYFPSHDAPSAESPRRWDRRLRRRIELLLEELRPELLVFDGAHPYDGLVAVLRGASRVGTRSVWCRRAMWRPGHGAEGIYWSGSFDAVLEPGELAESEDRGLTASRRAEAERVGPIVYLDRDELLPREQAEAELGLDPGRAHALVALGQGPDLDPAVERSLARLARDDELQVAALESSLAPGLSVPEEVVHLRATYPIGRYFRAFDIAIAAAGYNAFHELIAHGVPTLFVPMPRHLDDQPARARWARMAGVGEGVDGPLDPDLENRLDRLVRSREDIAQRLQELPFENGAAAAARLLEELARRPPGVGPGKSAAAAPQSSNPRPTSGSPTSTPRDALAVSAQLVRRVGIRLPLVVARRALDRVRNPPPAAAKLIVDARGLEGEELVERLRSVAKERAVEPARLLAITDSLDFAALRRAGFGFEYVPSEERAEPILTARGESYGDFVARRVAAVRTGRRPAKLIELQP